MKQLQQLRPLFAEQVLRVAKITQNYGINFPVNAGESTSSVNGIILSPPGSAGHNDLIRLGQKKINFLGPPNTVPVISYSRVLEGDYDKDYFKNKIVLIGATAPGIGDFLPTPMSTLQEPMSSVEFHANIMAAMLRAKLVNTPPKWVLMLICGLLATLPMLWIPSISPFNALITNITYFIFVASLGIFMPQLMNVWLPVSAALASIVFAYPVWSWRKLEAAQRYLDAELVSLRKSLNSAGLAHADDGAEGINDLFQSRISQVREASATLQEFRSKRYETLAFISHDIRTPLASAQMMLKDEKENPKFQRVINMLGRALNISESYLRASRAEMLTTQQFELIDLVAVCHQALDDAYELAETKHIKLVRNLPDKVVWLNGDFNLLHRAILNLLLNSIKYSNEHTEIALNFTIDKPFATIQIKDQGFGVAEEQIQKLFKRYSRLSSESHLIEGSGLGLYFVKTVTEKHAGTVSVTSLLGVGSEFSMHLPIVSD